MTEEQYLKSCSYARVLMTVRRLMKAGSTKVGRRKLRLLACGCYRLAFAGVPVDPAYQRLFDAAEEFADGRISEKALSATRGGKFPTTSGRGKLPRLVRSAESAFFNAAAVSPVLAAQLVSSSCLYAPRSPDAKARRAWQSRICGLARDIFGNPYRPVTFLDGWRTSTAVGLATAIYDERAFDRLPILADALQDAGCEDAAVIDHCRGGGHHDRGCWVVDLVLKKG